MSCYIRRGAPCTLQYDRTIKKRLKFILGKLKINKNWIILDIGTGFGIYIYIRYLRLQSLVLELMSLKRTFMKQIREMWKRKILS